MPLADIIDFVKGAAQFSTRVDSPSPSHGLCLTIGFTGTPVDVRLGRYPDCVGFELPSKDAADAFTEALGDFYEKLRAQGYGFNGVTRPRCLDCDRCLDDMLCQECGVHGYVTSEISQEEFIERVRMLVTPLGHNGVTIARRLLFRFGVMRVDEVPPERYREFLERASNAVFAFVARCHLTA